MRCISSVAVMAIMSGLLLAGCEVKDDKNASSEDPAASSTTPDTSQQSTIAAPQNEPAAQAPALQSQPGPDGLIADLNKVAVTGDVLTVQVTLNSNSSNYLTMKNDEISVIDDATAQRYSLLKDNAGKVLASPIKNENEIGNMMTKGGSVVFWFKFPAPPATSKTVSINLPGIAPFDGVPVTR